MIPTLDETLDTLDTLDDTLETFDEKVTHLMKSFVIGSGGREHALSWKLSQSDKVETVFTATENGFQNYNYLITNSLYVGYA
jgi:hypothetical protein